MFSGTCRLTKLWSFSKTSDPRNPMVYLRNNLVSCKTRATTERRLTSNRFSMDTNNVGLDRFGPIVDSPLSVDLSGSAGTVNIFLKIYP
uniref:Uncharacterized protein n=1 Tax=Vespula pensylvanica TaxID=30213 RepID=A0A834NWS2_VESPE|nr:hypothetical protein H0235_010277 [Vespula pensylvanica]